MKFFDKIQHTATHLKHQHSGNAAIGIILGSGLTRLVDSVRVDHEIPYSEIPHFPQSTIEGHAGKLIFGTIHERPVLMMAGRFHYYEGYSMEEITFPVRVMKALGIETLIVSNAAGSMHPAYEIGDIMIIRDQINLFPEHPLRGPNDVRLGTRFPDMSDPYDLELIARASEIAFEKGIKVHVGVYVGLQGPSFETRAEYQWLRTIGGDVVGMSTVPEVIVARHGGMRVFGASIVTDIGIREAVNTITHEEVLHAANEAAPRLAGLVADLISTM